MESMSDTQIELPRTYRGASLEQRQLERRAQLIEAAIAVYGETGFRQATVKAVCRRAGLTERYFYESFKGSEALLGAAFGMVMENLLAALSEAADAAGADPIARARAVLTAYYAVLKENPPGARVFLVEMFGISDAIDALLDKALKDIAAVILPGGVGPGHGAPELAAVGLVGGVIHIALTWIASGYALPVETVVESALPYCRAALS